MKSMDLMRSGALYSCADEELASKQTQQLEILYDFNATRPSEGEKREKILRSFFAEMGEGCYFEPPLHANWGLHTHVGNFVYANFNLTLVDDTDIYIGDRTMIGPNVTLATAGHPILPELREKVMQFNVPVTIGRNVWLGAGVSEERYAGGVLHDPRVCFNEAAMPFGVDLMVHTAVCWLEVNR